VFRILAFALAMSLPSHSALAKEALHIFNIVLLQPGIVLQERVPDVAALSGYIEGIEGAVSRAAQSTPASAPTGGFIVVAVKPGKKSNVWLDFTPTLKAQPGSTIQSAARSVHPPVVRDGVVVFAIKVGLWGGSEPAPTAPSPAEWKDAVKKAGRSLEAGELVEMIWRE